MTFGAQATDEVIKQYEPQRRFGPMRDKASFSASSSPMDDSRHYVYLHASLCAAESSEAVSGIEIATLRELAQSHKSVEMRPRALSTATQVLPA